MDRLSYLFDRMVTTYELINIIIDYIYQNKVFLATDDLYMENLDETRCLGL